MSREYLTPTDDAKVIVLAIEELTEAVERLADLFESTLRPDPQEEVDGPR